MASPSRPKRRASMTEGGPVMLSWFSATENAAPVERTTENQVIVSATPKPRPRPPPPSPQKPLPSVPAPEHVTTKTIPCSEVEIMGLELLRSNDNDTVDSFSFESYARDSFALAALANPHLAVSSIRGGGSVLLCTPSADDPNRRMSNCSSITGVDDRSVSLYPQNSTWSQALRRNSMESSSHGSDYYLIQPKPPRTTAVHSIPRRATMGCSHVPGEQKKRGLWGEMPRRGSTGANDLPEFGAYKARRRTSLGLNGSCHGAVTSGVSVPIQLAFNDISKHAYGKATPSSFGRRGSVGTSSSYGAQSSLGSGTDPLRGSSHGKLRRQSMGSCNSGELRLRT